MPNLAPITTLFLQNGYVTPPFLKLRIIGTSLPWFRPVYGLHMSCQSFLGGMPRADPALGTTGHC